MNAGVLIGRLGDIMANEGDGAGPTIAPRVLIVEDLFYLADDLRHVLTDKGFDVVGPVSTVERAHTVIADGMVDFAVLDINLRGELIFPVAADLRSRGIPFVFATGYDAETIPAEFQNVTRWEKPFPAAMLVDTIIQA